jgi:predicted phage-related endonuclease
MTTEGERSELKTELLPVCEADRSIPTELARIDAAILDRNKSIVLIEQEISSMKYDRECLLKRAKEVHVVEDMNYKIVEIPVYKKNRVAVDVLKNQFHDIYEKVRANIETRLQESHMKDLEKIDTFIPQADVKAVTMDKMVLSKVIPPNTEIEGVMVSIVRK